MALTVTFDTIRQGRIIITREPGEDAVAYAEYTVTDPTGRYTKASGGGMSIPLTAQQITQLNAFTASVLQMVKAQEGIP